MGNFTNWLKLKEDMTSEPLAAKLKKVLSTGAKSPKAMKDTMAKEIDMAKKNVTANPSAGSEELVDIAAAQDKLTNKKPQQNNMSNAV